MYRLNCIINPPPHPRSQQCWSTSIHIHFGPCWTLSPWANRAHCFSSSTSLLSTSNTYISQPYISNNINDLTKPTVKCGLTSSHSFKFTWLLTSDAHLYCRNYIIPSREIGGDPSANTLKQINYKTLTMTQGGSIN